MKWSLCMIVKNEEDNIAKCLDSTGDLFDEFCIVDTGSTDSTWDILMNYPTTKHLNLCVFKWIDDFAAARNYSFFQATGDFIMWLDADDIIPESSYLALRQLKDDMVQGKINADAYMFRYFYGELDFYRLRLVRRSLQYQWEEPIHEYIVHKGAISTVPQVIIQHTRTHTNGDRNIKILEKHKNHCTPRATYYFGRELIEHKRYAEAYKVLAKFVKTDLGWNEDLLNACNLLGHLLQDILGLKKEVREVDICRIVRQAFKYDIRPETCYIIGAEKLNGKHYGDAIRWLKLAMATPTEVGVVTGFIDKRYQEFFPALKLVVAYWEIKDYKQAYLWHEQCKKYEPNHASVLQNEECFQQLGIIP